MVVAESPTKPPTTNNASNSSPSPNKRVVPRAMNRKSTSNALHADTEWSKAFESLDVNGDGFVYGVDFITALQDSGLRKDDPRMKDVFAGIKQRGGTHAKLAFEDFGEVCKGSAVLVTRALSGQLIIPDFPQLCAKVRGIHKQAAMPNSGEMASYIPELANQNPNNFGISICSIDGQRFGLGEYQEDFCVQSCCKPIAYMMAIREHGIDKVHKHMGREPSGQEFNKLTLKQVHTDTEGHGRKSDSPEPEAIPHNPMINSGAIMSHALIQQGATCAKRFGHVINTWTELCGDRKAGFQNSTYLSEKDTADRNFCLGYMMRESKSFPEGTDLRETLEFYFQSCSIEVDCDRMSVLAATLANGGQCPTTGKRIFDPETVRHCLSLMLSCGMYTYSGEWAFSVGLPAKSGVAGAVFLVVPGVMGLCIHSPKLDEHGNSVRGVRVCNELVKHFNFHNFDNLPGVCSGRAAKKDPTKKTGSTRQTDIIALLFAGFEGDVKEIQRLVAQSVSLDSSDYDSRTALHLAASEGHVSVVEYLIASGVNVSPLDRWRNSPLNDAIRHDHEDVAMLLKKAGGRLGPGPAISNQVASD